MYRLTFIFVLVVVIFDGYIHVTANFTKETNCGDLCDHVSCMQADQEKCDLKTHDFVPRDGDCYCCNACICKNQGPNPNNIEDICDPKKCKTGSCVDQKMQDCKANHVLVPKDGLCHCCDTCVNIGGPVEIYTDNTDSDLCSKVRCTNHVPKDCKSQQVIVPGDFTNFCCDTCIDVYKLTSYDINDLMYQNPSNCEKGSCAKLDGCYAAEKDKCDPKTHIFIPGDNDCYCCDACVSKRIAMCH